MGRRASDTQLSVALWWKNLKATNNDSFLPLFFDEHRFLVLKGGGGSGKSIFAGRKVLERATSEPGHRVLVIRKVAKTIRHSCFDQLKEQAYTYYPEHIDFTAICSSCSAEYPADADEAAGRDLPVPGLLRVRHLRAGQKAPHQKHGDR